MFNWVAEREDIAPSPLQTLRGKIAKRVLLIYSWVLTEPPSIDSIEMELE